MGNRYTFLKELGRGAFGVVWLAEDKKGKKRVAVKELLIKSDKMRETLQREVKILQDASTPGCNPSVICYYESFEKDDKFYIVMEYIRGEELSKFAKRLKDRGEKEETICKHLIAIIKDVCGGLAYLNSKGIIHRDIKPENIMINMQYQPKLIDLGLSCFTYEEKENKVRKEKTCMINGDIPGSPKAPCCDIMAGSPLYMSPETMLKAISFYASDIWSLGVTIYQCLGKYIFDPEPDSMFQLRNWMSNPKKTADPLNSKNKFLNELVTRMVSKDIAARPKPLEIIKLIDEYNEKQKEREIELEKKDLEIAKKFERDYTEDLALEKSAELGSLALSKYFIRRGADPNWGLRGAAYKGDMNLINYFIEKGANVWDWGMAGAARGGHLELVEFFLEKGAEFLDWGMGAAAEGGELRIMKFFLEKGAKYWDYGLERAAKAGNMDLIKFFMDLGADTNWGLRGAAEGGNMDTILFFINQIQKPDIKTWNYALDGAAKGENLNVVKYFIEKGADDMDLGLKSAVEGGHKNIIKFFENLI